MLSFSTFSFFQNQNNTIQFLTHSNRGTKSEWWKLSLQYLHDVLLRVWPSHLVQQTNTQGHLFSTRRDYSTGTPVLEFPSWTNSYSSNQIFTASAQTMSHEQRPSVLFHSFSLVLDCDKSSCVTIDYPAVRSWACMIWKKINSHLAHIAILLTLLLCKQIIHVEITSISSFVIPIFSIYASMQVFI